MAYAQSASAKRGEFPRVRNRKAAVLWYLAHHGGALEDASGRATAVMNEAIQPVAPSKTGLTNFTATLTELEIDGLLAREVHGRRTKSLVLMVTPEQLAEHPHYGDDPWKRETPPLRVVPPREDEPEVVPALATEGLPALASAVPEVVVVEEEAWTPPPLDPSVDPQALLSHAITFIAQAMATSRPNQTEMDPKVLHRLSETLDENQRLRRKVGQAGDEIIALRHEVSGLRAAKRSLEANIATIAKGALDEPAYRRFIDLDRLVRTAPGSAKGE